MGNDDIFAKNQDGTLALRTVSATGDVATGKNDVYTRDSQGRLAIRVVGTSQESATTVLRGVGDIFSTTDTGVIAGAVDANGGSYNLSDYNSGTESLAVKLASGRLPYVSKTEFQTKIATGDCGYFGWNGAGGDKLYAWERNYSYVYTKGLTLNMHAPVYDADGTIIGRTADAIAEGDSEAFIEIKSGDSWTLGGSYTRYQDGDTTVSADATFLVPKLTASTPERIMVQLATGATDEALETCTDVLSDVSLLKDGRGFTNAGKTNIVSMGLPDYSNGVAITLPFTAPSAGLIAGWWYGDSSAASINGEPVGIAPSQAVGAGSLQVPVSTGDVFTISATPTSISLKFYPYKGVK